MHILMATPEVAPFTQGQTGDTASTLSKALQGRADISSISMITPLHA